MQFVTAEQAMGCLKTGDNVFVHGVAAVPQVLIQAMTDRGRDLDGLNIYHLHTEGDAPYAAPELRDKFHVHALFVGANMRRAVQEGRASYIPVFLSEMPLLFRRSVIPLQVALISVSPPDRHGYCTLGTSVDATHAAIEVADVVIAQINRHVPCVQGDGLIHSTQIDFAVEHDELLPEVLPAPLNEVERAIGHHIAGLIEDGSTLQTGIGNIPNAVLATLSGHRDLGIHTEMFSDGLLPLLESGVVNNSRKHSHQGKTVATFVMGSRQLYDYVDNNPGVALLDCQYVNNTINISKHRRMVAINSAIEIDLTGQVCADSIGNNIYSGVGGQMDFIRGASLSEEGKPIIALPSTTRHGESRIVPMLKRGAGVVTTRAHVHYVTTEYGIVNLHGMDLQQRARALIGIAHPDHREQLERETFRR